MFTLLLENTTNDRQLTIKLPIVPRSGDWIRIDYEDEFTEGQTLMTVDRVVLYSFDRTIRVLVKTID